MSFFVGGSVPVSRVKFHSPFRFTIFQESFRNLELWMEEIKRHARSDVIKILVGNKSDLEDRRKVTYEQGAVS